MKLIVVIVAALLVYRLQYRLYSKKWDEKLDIDISFEKKYMEQGEQNQIIEIISNDKVFPLPLLHIKYSVSRNLTFDDCENSSVTDMYHRNDVFSIMGHQRVTRYFTFRAKKRGYYTIDGVNVIARDIFLTKTFAKTQKSMAEGVYVFPKKFDNVELDMICKWMFGESESRMSLFEDPFSFGGIREYKPSDSMKRINWKATAKANQLMVNQYNPTSFGRVKIMLNLDTNKLRNTEYMQENAIAFTSSVAKYLIDNNMPVMVESNGYDIESKDVNSVGFGASSKHILSIDKYLSRIDKCGSFGEYLDIVEANIRKCEEIVTYIFVTAYYNEDLLLKLDYMAKKGVPVRLIVLYYDRYGFMPVRDYMKGWEVKLIEG